MLRRKGKAGTVGAFVDSQGSRKRPRQVPLSAAESDETGEKLESLVFGRQPFQPTPDAAESSSSEEVRLFSKKRTRHHSEYVCVSFSMPDTRTQSDGEGGSSDKAGGPMFSKDPSEVLQSKNPAWQDEDDQEIR